MKALDINMLRRNRVKPHLAIPQAKCSAWKYVGIPRLNFVTILVIPPEIYSQRTWPSLRVSEPATLHCWKPTQISSAPPQTPCIPFVKRSRRQSSTGCGDVRGSIQLYRTFLEVLLQPWSSLPPTLKGCWRTQLSPSGRPLALKPQHQRQQLHSMEPSTLI